MIACLVLGSIRLDQSTRKLKPLVETALFSERSGRIEQGSRDKSSGATCSPRSRLGGNTKTGRRDRQSGAHALRNGTQPQIVASRQSSDFVMFPNADDIGFDGAVRTEAHSTGYCR